MSLEKDIQEKIANAIDNDLSKQVGERLKKRLEEADKLEKDLEQKINQLEARDRRVKVLEESEKKLRDREVSLSSIKSRENALKAKEAKFEFNQIKATNDLLVTNNNFMMEILRNLSRNTETRKTFFANEPINYDHNGNQTSGGCSNSDTTITTE
jgi:DNA repair exonuclease SbcCD ATPase subunit